MLFCPVQVFSKINHKKIAKSELVLVEAHSNELAVTVLLKHCVNVISSLYKNDCSSPSRHMRR